MWILIFCFLPKPDPYFLQLRNNMLEQWEQSVLHEVTTAIKAHTGGNQTLNSQIGSPIARLSQLNQHAVPPH
jgi:hypothetical protein